jgi:hypothetical protein
MSDFWWKGDGPLWIDAGLKANLVLVPVTRHHPVGYRGEVPLRSWLILALLTSGLGAAARAETPEVRCGAPFADILSDKVFARYSVQGSSGTLRQVTPNVRVGRAHLYRTVIRAGAKKGADFAGHYTIIRIGCGAATVCVAIADAHSGKVYFPPELEDASALEVDTAGTDVDTLNYRRDSRLLIVVGSPNEKSARAGVSYYLWRSEKLSLIRFTPAAKLCALPKSTQF